VVEGIEAGADDYVTKPFNPHELKVRIRAGRRIIEMQSELMHREKLRGVLEMAGATCHEFNQPMQVISGYCELLMKELRHEGQEYDQVTRILEAVESMIKVTRKLQSITKYETREYIEGSLIIDIDKASESSPVGADVSE
jgi:DNA-binding response OmpR family regulator